MGLLCRLNYLGGIYMKYRDDILTLIVLVVMAVIAFWVVKTVYVILRDALRGDFSLLKRLTVKTLKITSVLAALYFGGVAVIHGLLMLFEHADTYEEGKVVMGIAAIPFGLIIFYLLASINGEDGCRESSRSTKKEGKLWSTLGDSDGSAPEGFDSDRYSKEYWGGRSGC